MCRGSGLYGVDSIETCPCVYRNFADAGRAQQQQQSAETARLHALRRYYESETEDQQRRRILGLDDNEPLPPYR